MDLRPIAFVTGVLLVILAATMLIPAAFDFFAGLSRWRGFMIGAGFTAFLGSAVAMRPKHKMSIASGKPLS